MSEFEKVDKIPPDDRDGRWKEIIQNFMKSDDQMVRITKYPEVEPMKKRASLDMALRHLKMLDKVKVYKRGKDIYLSKEINYD